ncbi:MAG: class I SAM-dependent methyltransferase [Betaproteobacteria bacterium]|nr:class I SAM-dependent methyltransferase [Betaproteobacteria bacterium]
MDVFFRLQDIPTNSCILLATREEALAYPRGDLDLAFCAACGFISNMAFDEKLTEYSGRYEETQSFSETFNAFHRELAQRLIERYDLRGKDVLEIGCGKGEFIALLAELGDNRGVGFDPGYREERTSEALAERLKFVKDFYSEKYSNYQADFVCCKMTLEHIHAASRFVANVRRAIGERFDTVVFFQIPEATRIVRDCAFEDIYYEHCSYFSPGSLARLFRRNGFDVIDLETEYAGQYLTIEARPSRGAAGTPLPQENDLAALARHVAEFPDKFEVKLNEWRRCVREASAKGRKIVLWGSGSKGVSFLTTLRVGGSIEYAVDINPHRQGYFMPTTGQRIVSPAFLMEYRPDIVIIMNAVYREEIARDLDRIALRPEMLTL